MGLFTSSSVSRFKDRFTETANLISSFSYGKLQLSDSVARLKIEANYEELKDLARGFANPYEEYFTIYLTSVAGEKLSIGQALFVIYEYKSQTLLFGVKMSNSVTEEIVGRSRRLSRTYEGQLMINNVVYK